jgi:Tfp pilus assembly protein PilO
VKSRESIWRQRASLLVVAALFLIANVGFLFGARSITSARRQALEQRRAALTSEVAAREAEASKLEVERSRLAQVSTVIDEFYGRRVGSRRETLAPIVEEIHSVMQRIGVSPVTISYSTSEIKSLPLHQMVIGFSFTSDYARFKRLLAAFEANRRWIVVRDVSLSRASEEAPGQVQVRMLLATYFSDDEKVPAPTVPVSPARRTVRTVERSVER